MRVVIQRVSKASVQIGGLGRCSVGFGLLILVGFEDEDGLDDIKWMSSKISKLRIFNDKDGLMNHTVSDVNGEIIVVSQFTLHALVKKGNRPSYIKAARPEKAIPLYEEFIILLERETGKSVKSGIFGANMKVSLVNDGPVTILVDSKNKE